MSREMKKIDPQKIKELFYDKDGDGILRWLVQVGKRGDKDCIAGHLHIRRDEHRWTIQIAGRKYNRSHIVFALYTSRWPACNKVLDHINKNTLDDSFNNLREVTQKENMQNRIESFGWRFYW